MSEMSKDALESKYLLYKRLTVVLAAVTIFLGLALVGQLTMNSPQASGPAANAAPEDAGAAAGATGGDNTASESLESLLARRDPDDPQARGDVDAPVVLVQWTDLRCPFCAAFHRDTLPSLTQEYIDAGLVRLEVHDVAFFGEQSEDAAVAARAAGNQGMFFEYLDAVYETATEGGHPDMPRERLIEFAQIAGVPDLAQFEADLDDPALRTAVQESTTLAQSIGVTAVPFFVAGDSALSGAQPVELFRQFLDESLEQAG